MPSESKTPIPGLLMLLVVSAFTWAESDALRRADLPRLGISLSVPEGWQEIPRDDLEIFSLTVAELSGGRAAETYHAGFASPGAETLFDLPYVLIQVRESGRLPYGLMLDLPPVDSVKRISTAALKEALGRDLSDVRLERLQFDRSSFSLRLRSVVDRRGLGPVIVETATMLTERGFVSVHCYEIRGRFETMAPVFDAVLGSIELSADLRYQPRIQDRWPILERLTWIHVALSAGFGILGGLIVYLVRRRRSARDGVTSG